MQLLHFTRYMLIVLTDGDWANDWLTHLDPAIQPAVMQVGEWISTLIGG